MTGIEIVRTIAEGITLTATSITALVGAIAGIYELGRRLGLWRSRKP